ncbi:MAG: M48 family metallopeptidase [Limisphaerales bacterium]
MNRTAHGFAAELFHPGLGNEVVKGRIFIEPRALCFQSDITTIEIPVGQLEVELGDDDGRIYFRDRKTSGLQIFTTDKSILHVDIGPSGTIRNHLEQVATRREITRRLRIMGYALAACIVFGWLGVLATHLMVISLVNRVPPDWEQKIGDEQIAELKGQGLLLDDSNRVAKLTILVAPLMRVVPGGTNFTFHIADAKDPNAFALPGGHIVINTGLLEIADNDELVGVMAHESAHIAQKHHAREIISSAGPFLICGFFLHSRSGLLNLLGEGSGMMLTRVFPRNTNRKRTRLAGII